MRLQGRGGDAVCEAAVCATIGMYAVEAIKKGRGPADFSGAAFLLFRRASVF
jgi:hypothetical protein